MMRGLVLLIPIACFSASAATTTLGHFANTTVNVATVDAAGNIYLAGYLGIPTAFDSWDAFVQQRRHAELVQQSGAARHMKLILEGLGVTGQAVAGAINPDPPTPLALPVTTSAPNAPVVSATALPALLPASGRWKCCHRPAAERFRSRST